MTEFWNAIAWEWVNIALEIATTSWVRLTRFPLAVAVANIATHPLLMVAVNRWGRDPAIVLPLEAAAVAVEWAILAGIYRNKASHRILLAASFVMNAVSFGTGILLSL